MASGTIKNVIFELLRPSVQLTSSHNMDDLVNVGVYYQSGNNMPSNAPSGANNAYILVAHARSTDVIQVWISCNTNKIYYRTFTEANRWTTWQTVAVS